MSVTTGPKAGPSNAMTDCEWWAYNRTGTTLTLGAVCTFDEAGASVQAETAASAYAASTTGGMYGNIITPATANIGTATAHPGYGGCVVIDLGTDKLDGTAPGADNTLVKVGVRGKFGVQITAAQDIVLGDRLGMVNAVYTMSETAATGVKIYAKADEAIASAVAGTLYRVHFNGIEGFGCEIG